MTLADKITRLSEGYDEYLSTLTEEEIDKLIAKEEVM